MPKRIKLDQQYFKNNNPCVQITPITQPSVLNSINKLNNNILAKKPETKQLEEQNSYKLQKGNETRHCKGQNTKVTEESCLDNMNKCILKLKDICYTCLSVDRNLTKLADVNDGISNLLYLVSCNAEAYEELNNCVEEAYICWECKAMINKFSKFRDQVCLAQKQLREMNSEKSKSLSKLSEHHQNFNNFECLPAEDILDKEKINFEPNNRLQTDDLHSKSCIDFSENLLFGKREEKYNKDIYKHILYDHGYAKMQESNHDTATADNNGSLYVKLDSNNTDTGQININSGSNEINLGIECEKESDIVKSISDQDDIETVEINDIENVRHVSDVIYESEFPKIHVDKSNYVEKQRETNVTELTTEKIGITEEITEMKTEITESETKVTEEGSEEDFLLVPSHPMNKLISKYEAHFTVIKMTVTEMEESIKQRMLLSKFTEANYRCEFCIEIFNNIRERKAHTIVHLKPFPSLSYTLCAICKVYVKNRWYKEHRFNHFLSYQCRYCDYVAFNILVVLKHLVLAHDLKVHSPKEEWWLKRRLQLTNSGTSPLNVDMSACEDSKLGYICLICNETFETLDLRNKHNLTQHHQCKRRHVTPAEHKCCYCKKTFRKLSKLKEHEMQHKTPSVLKPCPICENQVRDVAAHVREHCRAPRAPAACAACARVYPSRRAYLNHLKYTARHGGDKVFKYQCSFCDKRFIRKSSCRDHVNYTHRGISFECNLCHKKFASTTHVSDHMCRVHGGVREYLCPTCGIVCKDRYTLRDHDLLHSGGHVTCDICGGEFKKYTALNSHKYHAHKDVKVKQDAVIVEA